MKNQKNLSLTLGALLLLLVNFGCSDTCETTYRITYYNPVYTAKAEIRGGVAIEPGRLIETRGKLFFKGGYLFVNEPKNGIHIIDNRDPANPNNIAFIKVPGSFDIVVKDNYLFTDSYMDLVTFDISNLDAITEVNRIEDYFQAHDQLYYASTHQTSMVMTDLEPYDEVTETEDCTSWNPGWRWSGNGRLASVAFAESGDASGALAKAPGIAGSLARFALADDNLYALDAGLLKNLNIASPLAPVNATEAQAAWDSETLFPRGDELFIGAASGMHIFDISNRDMPEYISSYNHVNSCDPVIVEGDLAFVTLRSGTLCDGFTNQLEVIDISDLQNPRPLHIFPMFNPHGLTKDGNTLFICDGEDGLKVFDASDISAIDQNLIAHDRSIQAYDIIAFNNVAMLIGDDGLYQYDYSDLNNIRLLSTIQINFDD
ncbi:MAG: hypothetical protein Roseis2KO_30870 [Roseivirga sp.]